jgi:hypothetical protein
MHIGRGQTNPSEIGLELAVVIASTLMVFLLTDCPRLFPGVTYGFLFLVARILLYTRAECSLPAEHIALIEARNLELALRPDKKLILPMGKI